jgi:hypothetical protein
MPNVKYILLASALIIYTLPMHIIINTTYASMELNRRGIIMLQFFTLNILKKGSLGSLVIFLANSRILIRIGWFS